MTLEDGAVGEQRRGVGDDWLLPADAAALELRRQDYMATQRGILLDSSRHALTQARVSFWIAVAFSTAGSMILLGAVGLAVLHLGNGGQQYPAVIASIAGTVTNLSAGVFYLQSTRTRLGMVEQARMMREHYLETERIQVAMTHLSSVSDPQLRDRVLAQSALRILTPNGAEPVSRPADDPVPGPAAEQPGSSGEASDANATGLRRA